MARKNTATVDIDVDDLENFEDIGKLTASHVREPKLYPDGPWTIKNVGVSVSDVEDKDGNEQKKYNFRYIGFEPGEEVDPELVEEGGFEGRTLWVARWISKPAAKATRDGTLARFINFIELHGIDTDGMDVDGMCKAAKGEMVMADLGRRTWTDKQGGEHTDNTVSNLAPVSD